MSIGSIGGSGFGFGQQQSFRIDIKKEDTEGLKKQLSVNSSNNRSQSTTSPQSAGGLPPGGPGGVGGFPGGEPPKELSRDDLSRIKDGISKAGGQGADKIDDLIKNFDQYDTNGTGKISVDQFKSYASQNGIDLPKPSQRPQGRGDFPQSLPAGAGEGGDVGKSISKAAVAGLLNKYASSVTTSSSTTQQSTSGDTNSGSTSQTGSTSATSQSSGKSESEKSTAELKTDAANGDTEAQKELDKREAAAKAKGLSSEVTVSASISVEA